MRRGQQRDGDVSSVRLRIENALLAELARRGVTDVVREKYDWALEPVLVGWIDLIVAQAPTKKVDAGAGGARRAMLRKAARVIAKVVERARIKAELGASGPDDIAQVSNCNSDDQARQRPGSNAVEPNV